MTAEIDYLGKLRGVWHYVRRVPVEYAHLDKRVIVRISTKIKIADDPRARRAGRIVRHLNEETELYWRSMVSPEQISARQAYEDAVARARREGLVYRTASQLASGELADLLARLRKLEEKVSPTEAEVAAVLGGREAPPLMISKLFDLYKSIMAPSLGDMAEDQLRKWEAPKRRALEDFLAVVDDKAISNLTRTDVLEYQAWWRDRVTEDGVQVATANKNIGHVRTMLRRVCDHHWLGLPPEIYSSTNIPGNVRNQRVAYDINFLGEAFLAPGAFDGLNLEAAGVVFVVLETGLRLSEVCNLTNNTIHLSGPIPYLSVEPEERRMKTSPSRRQVPVMGVALAALQRFPNGFPRYRHKADSLSALVNKYLANNGLRPKVGQSVYSLRHTFEDRLTEAHVEEKVIAALMGHKQVRERYGHGPSLETKKLALEKIVHPVPAHISERLAAADLVQG